MAPCNILYLQCHDAGRFIQPYGHAVETPNLQRLAQQGILFRQAFSGAPTCSPSRAVLLTGECAHSCGMIGLAHRGFRLKDYGHHIVHTLRAGGYWTVIANDGSQHVAPKTEMIGYDEILSRAPGREKVPAEDLARDFICARPKQPFFLSVGFSDTHREFREPACDSPQTDPRFTRPPSPLPDTPETRRDMAAFNTSCRSLDRKMGAVLDALDTAGLAENTLVVCTTDHGIAFPRMKCNLTDAGLGVFLILRGPGGFRGGKAVDGLVSHIDIFPTLCEAAGLPLPPWLQGVSLVPLVQGEAREVREELFAEVSYHAAYEPQRCVRTRRWKYIRRWGAPRGPVLPNCDDSISKRLWMDGGWAGREEPAEALYDLLFDPNEIDNRAADPALKDVLGDMRGRLERWMRQTQDPLLSGSVPAPEGARVNDPKGLSPKDPPQPPSAFGA